MPSHRLVSSVLVLVALVTIAAVGCSDDEPVADRRDESSGDDRDPSSGGPTTSAPSGGTSPVQDGIRIEVLSSQPDRATGDEARIRVTPARGGSPTDLRVELGSVDVTPQLEEVDGHLEGVVTGLVEGTNTLTASSGPDSTTQRVRSWPVAGPMISGPHLPLPACSTDEHGLGAPTDANCSAPTVVSWHYVAEDDTVKELTDPTKPPSDLATATIDGTDDVPLYIRYEQGVINRSIYEIASIDPTPGGDAPDSTEPSDAAWNGRLLYRYGGGCGATFGQGSAQASTLDPTYLAQGYAVATASFNTFAVQCNDVLSAETTMMVKERFIEAFGQPDHTIGEGGSGGAIQVHLITQNYPGLLDGVVASSPFPDAITISGGVTDCGLLNRYYDSAEGAHLTPEQRTAVNGHATDQTCRLWEAGFLGVMNPSTGCDPKISADQIYDATTNPTGIRCTLQDANANQLGRDDETGFARRPLDNVGIQYGLEALNAGTISVDEFLDLNDAVGGWDIDGGHQPDREVASVESVLHAYETGRISTGAGDQTKVPIIDVNTYLDEAGDIHDRFRAFSLRERLTMGGPDHTAPGFQIWTRDADQPDASSDAVRVVDEWLTSIAEDTEGGDRLTVLERNRPAAAVDNCQPTGRKRPIGGVGIYEEEGPCHDDYPLHGDPRIVAGAPLANDIIKCELKPIDPSDYEVELGSEQLERLDEIFPEGVCDWRRAGVGQTTPSMTDRSYEDVTTPADLA